MAPKLLYSSNMAATLLSYFVVIIFVANFLLQGANSTIFTFKNNCPYTVWPATLQGGTSPPLSETGFQLGSGATKVVTAPTGWNGRMWARRGCGTDGSGRFSCETADCGRGSVACNGAGGVPPATLLEFKLQGDGGKDFYDVSLVDGFNTRASISPQGGFGDCRATSCATKINLSCPGELQVKNGRGEVVGCKSACVAFNSDQYCCRGAYNNDRCPPTNYSMFFKNACPDAYSYAYDDRSSTRTCTGANYLLTFCP